MFDQHVGTCEASVYNGDFPSKTEKIKKPLENQKF